MKYSSYLFITLLVIYSCPVHSQEVSRIIQKLKKPTGKEVLVVAHRGDWRNAPENSVLAIQSAIEMGVDIVEIDVRKTKDGHLVIMHDETVDRTTNGKGYINGYTLDSLRKLYLKNGLGRVTYHRIPTLEEAMLAAKGKAMVNLDKCYDYLREAYPILIKTGTLNQAIFKGNASADQVKKEYGDLLDKLWYIPMVYLDKPNAITIIEDFQKQLKPVAFELIFASDTSSVLNATEKIKARGSRIWLNTLWANLNGGHDDDLAETNTQASYDWILQQGANLIQTDRPRQLLSYLKAKGLHR